MGSFSVLQAVLCGAGLLLAALVALVMHSALKDCAAAAEGHA